MRVLIPTTAAVLLSACSCDTDFPAPPDAGDAASRLDAGSRDGHSTADSGTDDASIPDAVVLDVLEPDDVGPDGGMVECRLASDCPAPAACRLPAACAAGRCDYPIQPAGTVCRTSSDPCAPNLCTVDGTCAATPIVCNSPPPSADFRACAPGRTFTVSLGGACGDGGGMCDPSTGTCSYDQRTVNCPSGATTLPQRHAHQVVLRGWLAGLSSTDFDVDATRPVTFDPSWPLTNDELYRLYLAVVRHSGAIPELPSRAGMMVPSSRFTLAAMEERRSCTTNAECNAFPGEGVPSTDPSGYVTCTGGFCPPRALVGRESPVSFRTAFYSVWDYRGNPYFGARAPMLRAFAMASADMMLQEECLDSSRCRVDDDFHGAFREYATISWLAHRSSHIDGCALAAYDASLRRLFERWEAGVYPSTNGNMTLASMSAVFYTAEALEDPSLRTRALEVARRHWEASCVDDGWCRHRNGHYDASYEGWSESHLVEAALVSRDPTIEAWARSFSALRAYQTLTEPNGVLTGPSHFSTSTSLPAARDQGNIASRHAGAAMLSDEAIHRVHGLRAAVRFRTPMQMRMDIAARIAEANDWADEPPSPVFRWRHRHYPDVQNPGFVHYQAGTYARIASLGGMAPLGLPPMERGVAFVRSFDQTIAAGRAGALGALVFVGGIDGDSETAGFGGGGLSAVWSPRAGVVLQGWTRGAQGTPPFRWSDVLLWPMHALTGTRGSATFSTARIPSVTSSNTSTSTVLALTTRASVDAATRGSADPGRALAGSLTVDRAFRLEESTLTVQTTVTSSGNTLEALYDVLPIYLGEAGYGAAAGTTIQFRTGSGLVAAGSVETANVQAVVVTRFGARIEFVFDVPRTARLAPTDSTTAGYQWEAVSRNVLVRLHDGGAVPATLRHAMTVRAL